MARNALRQGFKLALLLSVSGCVVVMLAHHWLARLYAGDNPAVVALAASLLLWAAAYHVADAMQALCVFILRSYGVAFETLVVYCLLLWGVGLGGGYLLAYRGVAGIGPLNSPVAFWSAGAAALALTSVIFIALLWRAVRARRGAA